MYFSKSGGSRHGAGGGYGVVCNEACKIIFSVYNFFKKYIFEEQ